MGKPLADIKLLLVLLGQLYAVPLAIGLTAFTQIHRHIEHTAADHAHQLALGILLLEVQTAQNALGGHALVVLHKDHIQAKLMHIVLVIGLHKIAAAVPVDSGLDHIQALNGSLGHFDLCHY